MKVVTEEKRLNAYINSILETVEFFYALEEVSTNQWELYDGDKLVGCLLFDGSDWGFEDTNNTGITNEELLLDMLADNGCALHFE